MSRFVGYEACPKCRDGGRDRRGDNFAKYSDGSGHCFSCSHHEFPRGMVRFSQKEEEVDAGKNKAVLPNDFSREVPARGWKWLLQYGLPYTYWKPYTGYSEKHDRLILTFGEPTRFSIGRYLGTSLEERKWKAYGDVHGYVEILGKAKTDSTKVVVVEDLVSAHKVAQVAPCLPLFGTQLNDLAVKELIAFKRPVSLWLDADQYTLLAPKIRRLQTFLDAPVGYVHTTKDPKGYSTQEIQEILDGVSC